MVDLIMEVGLHSNYTNKSPALFRDLDGSALETGLHY